MNITNYIKENALTKTNKINHHFINRLTGEEIENIYKITNFCPEYISLKIRVKLIIDDISVFPKCVVCNVENVKTCAKGYKLLDVCSKKCAYHQRVESTKKSNIKKYGVSSTNKLKHVKEKIKSTLMERYGVHSYTLAEDFKNKSRKTKLKLYGNENFVNTVKSLSTKLERYNNPYYNNQQQREKTCIKRYGVRHPMQLKEIFEKQQNSLYKAKYYKGIYYRSKSEYKFILLCEKYDVLQYLRNCDIQIKYVFDNKEHIYYPDFILGENNIIEIKTSWSYNKNGKDKKLGLLNDAKWNSAKNLKTHKFHVITMRKGKKSTRDVKLLADSILKNII